MSPFCCDYDKGYYHEPNLIKTGLFVMLILPNICTGIRVQRAVELAHQRGVLTALDGSFRAPERQTNCRH